MNKGKKHNNDSLQSGFLTVEDSFTALAQIQTIQRDYKHIVKRKGKLERL